MEAGKTGGSFMIRCRSWILGSAFSWRCKINFLNLAGLLHRPWTSRYHLCFLMIETITLPSFSLLKDGLNNNNKVPQPHTMIPWTLETASWVFCPHLSPRQRKVNCQQGRRHQNYCKYYALFSGTTTQKTMKNTQQTRMTARWIQKKLHIRGS